MTIEHLSSLGLALAGLLPSLVLWYRERMQRRYAEQQLKMARAVTAMEKLMLEGRFKDGQHCHDRIFKAMQHVQYLDETPRLLIIPNSPEGARVRSEVAKEIKEAGDEAARCMREFGAAFLKGLKVSRPFYYHWYQFRVLWCIYLERREKKSTAKLLATANRGSFKLAHALVMQAALVALVSNLSREGEYATGSNPPLLASA